MAARKRRFASRRRKKQNVEWFNASATTAINLVSTPQYIELIPDAMEGLALAPDFLLKRIVGSMSVSPQDASTASTTVGLAIIRTLHGADGVRETVHDPLSTDADSGSQDILWQKQFLPSFGGPLDATVLDYSHEVPLDIGGRTLRKLDKRHGIFLVHIGNNNSRLRFTFRFRILGALST